MKRCSQKEFLGVKTLLFALVIFYGAGCVILPKKDMHQLEKEAIKLALENLDWKVPLDKKFYAGVGASRFINGARIGVSHREVTYQLDHPFSKWNKRVHWVTVKLILENKRDKDRLLIKYEYIEDNPNDTKLKLKFIHGFPSENYFHLEDPLKKYRRNRRLIAALKRRSIYKGMPEKAVFLSWGKPQTTETRTYLNILEKRFIYGRNVVVIRKGKVFAREKK